MQLIVLLTVGEALEHHELLFKLKHLIAALVVECLLLVTAVIQLGVEQVSVHGIVVCTHLPEEKGDWWETSLQPTISF